MTGDEIADAVMARLVVELGLDNLSEYAVRSVVMLTMNVCEENGLMTTRVLDDADPRVFVGPVCPMCGSSDW